QSARDAFPKIVRALVTQVRNDVPASIRRVPEANFLDDLPTATMINALREARLIISDRGELRFTHDSLLTGWVLLKEQIAEEQRLFNARESLEQACEHWVKSTPDPTNIRKQHLLRGFQRAQGRELLAKWGEKGLSDREPQLPAFIKASDASERRVRRRVQAA